MNRLPGAIRLGVLGTSKVPSSCGCFRRFSPWLWQAVLVLAAFGLGLTLSPAASQRQEHPEYLIHNWSAGEGVPENSALAIAQTPDGYLWVGSVGGLLRFNAVEFERVSRSAGLKELDTTVHCLSLDRAERLWVSTSTGLAVLEQGNWRLIKTENLIARTVAQATSGEVFVGATDGRLFRITNDVATPVPDAPGLAPSGVFLVPDAKTDRLWLANRKFVGQWTPSAWQPVGPQPAPRGSLLAAAARAGGLWVYFEGQLWRYHAEAPAESWKAPAVDQPRELFEDTSGTLWITSATLGLVRWRPGGPVSFINATNGLSHNSARSLFQDAEENLWVGTSSSGLFRFRPRQFFHVGAEAGLSDRIVKTVTEIAPGTMVVGTHGSGSARLANGQLTWRPSRANGSGAYAWSVLRDRAGRVWTGTFNTGLLVEENGVERPFPLPPELGPSVGALLEDSQGRLWVGASLGLGVIEQQVARVWPRDEAFANLNVRSIVEDPQGQALWVGTFGRGLWRVDLRVPGRATHIEGLPRKRITALARDQDGCVWAGVFGEGLYCLREGRPIPVGRRQGLPANTIGSILEDGRGCFWLGSDQGILRVSAESLHRVVQGLAAEARFTLFDRADGMDIPECSEGFQPAACRDSLGQLWFGTLHGVVRVDPARLRLNERPAPVHIERFSFIDRSGTNHTLLAPGHRELIVPPGSTDLEVRYAALSYMAPEKIQYAYYLEGAAGNQVLAGNRRVATFPALPPGHYRLQVKASNNDGVWNEHGATLAFAVQPFLWQTLWFRCLTVAALAAAIGLGGWRVARARYRGQIERLEQQRTLALERARLAAVMEATTDLVAFADAHGNLLHLNPAGRHLLGLEGAAAPGALKLRELFAPRAALQLETEGIPAAERQGTWQGESALHRRDGQEIPVSQVVMAHRDPTGQVSFLSTIARDISEQKRAAEERDRLQNQLAQAQKIESVGRLAGGVAHDFNNMLQVILGNVEMALAAAPAGSSLQQDLLEIQRSAQRSAALTSQLLAFARRQAVCPRILDLNATLSSMLQMLARLIGESIQLTWVPGPNLWPVKMDPAQVDQILANLAVNARDAIAGEGSLTVQTANFLAEPGSDQLPPECPPGEYVTLTVTDTGSGMSPEVLEHLFEPFFTTKALGQGTGLGLATVFGIVKQNGGAITVSSQPAQGTTFRIFLPRAQAAAAQPEVKTAPLRGGTETILLVEDEPKILHLGCRALQNQGYTVLAASLPEAALDLARRHPGPIDLVISDIVMPQMNGKQLRHHLAQLRPGIKCLYMSGYTNDILARHGGLDPSEAFLEKPFTLQDFTDKVRTLLQG